MSALLSSAERDALALLAAAETDWKRPVPHCPDWDAVGLVVHTGGILNWIAAIVTSGERVSRRTLDPAPQDSAALSRWFVESLAQTLAALRAANPRDATWTFSSIGDRTAGWWCRRLAVEVAIHRWDVQHAARFDRQVELGPLDGEVAALGIEEFIVEFLPGLLTQDGVEGLGGTLHLHATDGPVEWWIDLASPETARPQHAKADTAVRGTRSDLLLWLTTRGPLDTIEVLGDSEITGRWRQLRR